MVWHVHLIFLKVCRLYQYIGYTKVPACNYNNCRLLIACHRLSYLQAFIVPCLSRNRLPISDDFLFEDTVVHPTFKCVLKDGYLDHATSHDLYIKNFDIFFRLLLIYPRIFNFVDHIQALDCPPKYCVLIIQPRLHID
jgi:hypothetical protein